MANKQNKVTCVVTGVQRVMNKFQLKKKATAAGLTPEEWLKTYASREAVKLLRTGKTVDEVRSQLGALDGRDLPTITTEQVATILKQNGRQASVVTPVSETPTE